LVVCDMQPDLLGSIPIDARKAMIAALKVCIDAARQAHWPIIFTGLRFPKGYGGLEIHDRLYGGLKRLNIQMGDGSVHWFLEGFKGAEIEPSLVKKGDCVAWRQRHLPASELLEIIKSHNITNAVVTGIKAGYAVQATCQVLCNAGIQMSFVKECVQDDKPARLSSILAHLLPIYADAVTVKDLIEHTVGMAQYVQHADPLLLSTLKNVVAVTASPASIEAKYKDDSTLCYCTDCGRVGHGAIFCQLLLERPDWCRYPSEAWYWDHMRGSEYRCPVGKMVVEFADEPKFSQIAMYLKGRDWLDEKDLVVGIARDFMPKTWHIQRGNWLDLDGSGPPSNIEGQRTPWFVKEVTKNWGNAVVLCRKPSEVMGLVKRDRDYVVQQHVPDPLLTDDGRKAHIKFYCMLMCLEDGVTWQLFTYKEAFLSISPNKWDPNDLSADTQVTILRHPVPVSQTKGWKQHWPDAYTKCKAGTANIVRKSVVEGKLVGRLGQKQFEVFSADWMMDSHGKAWLFEFNMSPALCQHDFSRKRDRAMLRGALSIALPSKGQTCGLGLWDTAGVFQGSSFVDLPKQKTPSSAAAQVSVSSTKADSNTSTL